MLTFKNEILNWSKIATIYLYLIDYSLSSTTNYYIYKNQKLIIKNKIAKPLSGPSIFLGLTFLFLGVVFCVDKNYFAGLALLLLAAFLFLTYSGVEINTETQKIKSYYKVFGIIERGKWESLKEYKGVTLVPIKKTHSVLSRSNRQTSRSEIYFQIYLVNKALKPKLQIKKCKTMFEAQNSLDEFSIWLKMPVFSVKR